MSYPKIDPPTAATMHAITTYKVTLPWYSSALSLATPVGTKPPAGMVEKLLPFSFFFLLGTRKKPDEIQKGKNLFNVHHHCFFSY